MILKKELKNIVLSQRNTLETGFIGIKRDILKNIDMKSSHIIILSGIRRSGKSTLLYQIASELKEYYYFNFEDPSAINFELSDFIKLSEIFIELYGKKKIFFFDEIQNIPDWERAIRNLHDQGNKIVITGSNSSMLSQELGTKLTGRHLSYELFPFSFSEFLKFTKNKPSSDSFKSYMKFGGFPEFLKTKNITILQQNLRDIVYRDIIGRYKLRNDKRIMELLVYLITNIGKETSYNKLAINFEIPSVNSILDYVNYFENSYLMFTVPKFDFSFRKQIKNPKKIYTIDSAFGSANSASFSEDYGRVFENIIFLNLRRKSQNTYYFKGKGECDFVLKDSKNNISLYQVCFTVTPDNLSREINGLKEAMKYTKVNSGIILTFNQEENLKNGIKLVPAWKWTLL